MKLIAGYRLSHMKFSCSKVVVGANSINYCSDSSEMWMSSMAVRDILLFSSTLTGANAASYADAFDLLGIKELSDQSFGSLSAGQKQRVHLAQSILQPEPSLMLLDEPLSALDENNAISCLRLLQLLPTSHSFVITVHKPSPTVASMFDRMIVLSSQSETTVTVESGEASESFERKSSRLIPSSCQSSTSRHTVWRSILASYVLWNSHFAGLPILEGVVAAFSAIIAMSIAFPNRNIYVHWEDDYLLTARTETLPFYMLNLLSACVFLTSMGVSYIYVAREMPIINTFTPPRQLHPAGYVILSMARLLFYGLIQGTMCVLLGYSLVNLLSKDADTAIFNIAIFVLAWGTFSSFLFVAIHLFIAVCVVVLTNLFLVSKSGIAVLWSASSMFSKLMHYLSPLFYTLSANCFLALQSFDTGCKDFDTEMDCISALGALREQEVQPKTSGAAQGFCLCFCILFSAAMFFFLRRKYGPGVVIEDQTVLSPHQSSISSSVRWSLSPRVPLPTALSSWKETERRASSLISERRSNPQQTTALAQRLRDILEDEDEFHDEEDEAYEENEARSGRRRRRRSMEPLRSEP